MFNSSEQELRHFIDKMSASDWEWKDQYEEYSFTTEDDDEDNMDCTDTNA